MAKISKIKILLFGLQVVCFIVSVVMIADMNFFGMPFAIMSAILAFIVPRI
jgi:hypothetical protein